MRRLLLATALCASLASAAHADFVLNPTQVGQSGVVNYNGIVEGNPVAGLTGQITFTLQGVVLGTNLWTFGYGVDNTSSGAITSSRISTFGFNTDPALIAANYLTGTVFTSVSSGNVPQLGVVEFCATAGPNCAGGSGVGVLPGDGIVSGSFSLDFDGTATNATQIAFSDLYVRYQSIVGTTFGDSGIGTNGGPTPFCTTPPCTVPVPGPIVGAGLPGIVMALMGLFSLSYWRRRRRHQF